MSDIVKAEQTGILSQVNLEDFGLEGWTVRDFVIPRLRIAQPTSQVEITPGKFYDSLSLEAWDKVRVVFLKSSWGRVLYGDEGVKCRSMDRIKPSEKIENPPSEYCHTCPYSKWGEDGSPPECKEQLINFVLKVNEDFTEIQPYIYTVHGANLKPLKTLISLLVARKQPLYTKVVEMTTEMVTNGKGKYYVVKYKIVDDVPKELIDQFREMAKAYTSSVAEQSFEAEEQHNEESVDF